MTLFNSFVHTQKVRELKLLTMLIGLVILSLSLFGNIAQFSRSTTELTRLAPSLADNINQAGNNFYSTTSLTDTSSITQQPTTTPQPRVWLPVLMKNQLQQPFDAKVDGFNFPNYFSYQGGPQYTQLTSIEMRRFYGEQVCASNVAADGTCTLTPPAQRWLETTNYYMNYGHCEGLAAVSLLMYNGYLNPRDFGAARAIDLTLTNNSKLQREIAYWFASAIASKSGIGGLPNDVLAAVRGYRVANGSSLGTLRFSKADGSGGHAVAPIGLEERGNGVVAIQIYDNNYPRESREILINTVANTWFYSPDPVLTEDDYTGDAESQTLSFAPLSPRVGQQPCFFCLPTPTSTPTTAGRSALQVVGTATATPIIFDDFPFPSFPTPLPSVPTPTPTLSISDLFSNVKPQVKLQANLDGSQCSLDPVTKLGQCGKAFGTVKIDIPNVAACFRKSSNPLDFCDIFPGANQQVTGTVKLNSWDAPMMSYYPIPMPVTSSLKITLSGYLTESVTSTLNYIGPGYVFDVDNLYLEPGENDMVEVGLGGKVITYTTDSGSVPDLFVGIEQPEADFGFTFHSFDMLPTDMVMLGIDTVHKQLDVRVDTIAASGEVIFDFEMVRLDDATEEIFESPQEGLDINNGEMLIIDYGSWQGGNSSLRVGYDSNENGILDTAEELQWQDAPSR